MSTVFESLQKVSQLLQTAPTVSELAEQLGQIMQDNGSEIIVQPDDASFTRLNVAALPDSSEPAHIRLRLAEPLALSSLREQFGAPQKVPPTPSGKRRQIFNNAYPGTSYNVTLIVDGGDPTVDLVLRRDISLG